MSLDTESPCSSYERSGIERNAFDLSVNRIELGSIPKYSVRETFFQLEKYIFLYFSGDICTNDRLT